MSDCPYILQTEDPRELWLVDGEQRMRVSRDMYWLLTSQGAELPPLHDISDLLAENAALRQQLADVTESVGRLEERCAKMRELVSDYERCSMHADCGRCEYDGTTSTHCPHSPCFPDIDELRELGVEVRDE